MKTTAYSANEHGVDMWELDEEPFDSAEAFLDALKPQLWLEGHKHVRPGWIFRGQSNANSPLKPSAWRDKARRKLGRFESQFNTLEWALALAYRDKDRGWANWHRREAFYQRTLIELAAVTRFAELADSIGAYVESETLETPSRYIERRQNDQDSGREITLVHPSRAMALAQHHGVPTRLLDFTRSPRIAAYFAATEATKDTESKKIGVFAIREYLTDDPGCGVSKYTVPRHQFEFLHAQHGLFLYVREPQAFQGIDGEWPDFIKVYQHYVEHSKDRPRDEIRLLTLPREKSAELIQLLKHEGVTRAHLMPTYDNVTAEMKERGDLLD